MTADESNFPDAHNTSELGVRLILSGKDISQMIRQNITSSIEEELNKKVDYSIKIAAFFLSCSVSLISILGYIGIKEYVKRIVDDRINADAERTILESVKSYISSPKGMETILSSVNNIFYSETMNGGSIQRTELEKALQPYIARIAEETARTLLRDSANLIHQNTDGSSQNSIKLEKQSNRIIVASYGKKEFAESYLEKAKQTLISNGIKNYTAVMCSPTIGYYTYKISIGKFSDFLEATEFQKQLLGIGFENDIYISSNPRLAYTCND